MQLIADGRHTNGKGGGVSAEIRSLRQKSVNYQRT